MYIVIYFTNIFIQSKLSVSIESSEMWISTDSRTHGQRAPDIKTPADSFVLDMRTQWLTLSIEYSTRWGKLDGGLLFCIKARRVTLPLYVARIICNINHTQLADHNIIPFNNKQRDN